MKKRVLFSLAMFFYMSLFSVQAQNDTSLSLPDHTADNLHWHGLSVKTGDSVIVSASVFDASPRQNRFWKSFAKSVAPAFVLNRISHRTVSGGNEQITNSVNFGAGVALVPGAIDLATKKKNKAYVALTVYDTNGNLIATEVNFAGKAARQDWEAISIKYIVKKDGYFNVDVVGREIPNIKVQLNSLKKWSFNKKVPIDSSLGNTADPGTTVDFVCYGCGESPPGGGYTPSYDPGNYGGNGSAFGNDPYYNDSPWSPGGVNGGAGYPNGSDASANSDNPLTCPLARQCRNAYRRIRDNNIKKAYVQYFTIAAGCVVAGGEVIGTVTLSTAYLAAINPILPAVAGGLAGATVGVACIGAAAYTAKLDIENAIDQCNLDIQNNCKCK